MRSPKRMKTERETWADVRILGFGEVTPRMENQKGNQVEHDMDPPLRDYIGLCRGTEQRGQTCTRCPVVSFQDGKL